MGVVYLLLAMVSGLILAVLYLVFNEAENTDQFWIPLILFGILIILFLKAAGRKFKKK